MKKSAPEIQSKIETVTVEVLAELSGLTTRWIQKLAEDGIVPKDGRNQYPRDAAIKVLFTNLREQTTNVSARTKEHAEREARASATKAEIEAAKAIGEVVLAKDVALLWEDGATRWRVCIETRGYLTEEQKTRLCADLSAIKLSEEKEP